MKKLSLAIVTVFFLASSSFATSITFELDFEFSGATSPAGSSPWLTATFDDGGSPGMVTLTMSTSGLVGSEKVTGWYFNVDPTLTSLAIDYVSGQVASATDHTQNDHKADGDGKYDILFEFPTSGDVFGAGETSVWKFTATGLTANSFDFLSAPAGGHGPFLVAAHVQSIGTSGGSGWITGEKADSAVPEPTTMALVAAGISAFAMKRKRFT